MRKRYSVQVGVNISKDRQRLPTFVMVVYSVRNGDYFHNSNGICKSEEERGLGSDIESVCIGKWHGCILHNSFKQNKQTECRRKDSLITSLIKQIHPYNRFPLLKDSESSCFNYNILNRVSEVSVHAISSGGNNNSDIVGIIATWDVDCSVVCDDNIESSHHNGNKNMMSKYERHIESCPVLIRIPPSLFNDPDEDEYEDSIKVSSSSLYQWFTLKIDFTLEQGGDDGDEEDEDVLRNSLVEQCRSLIDVIFFNRYNPSNTNPKYSNIWSDAQVKTSRLDSTIIRSALISQHWKWNTILNKTTAASHPGNCCSDVCCLDAVKLMGSLKLDTLQIWPSHIDCDVGDNNDTVKHVHASHVSSVGLGRRGAGAGGGTGTGTGLGRQTYSLPSAIDFSSNVTNVAHHPGMRQKQKRTAVSRASPTKVATAARNMKKRGRGEIINGGDVDELIVSEEGVPPSKILKTAHGHIEEEEEVDEEEDLEEVEEDDEVEGVEEDDEVDEDVEEVDDDEEVEEEEKDAFANDEIDADEIDENEGEVIEETPYDIDYNINDNDDDNDENGDACESEDDEIDAPAVIPPTRYKVRTLSKSTATPPSKKVIAKKGKK